MKNILMALVYIIIISFVGTLFYESQPRVAVKQVVQQYEHTKKKIESKIVKPSKKDLSFKIPKLKDLWCKRVPHRLYECDGMVIVLGIKKKMVIYAHVSKSGIYHPNKTHHTTIAKFNDLFYFRYNLYYGR